MMGGAQAKCEIAKYNENITKTCDHCYEAESIADHIKRSCKTPSPYVKGLILSLQLYQFSTSHSTFAADLLPP